MAALYLKYRPQNLSELFGQENVKKTLQSAFEAGKISHAYLFVGPRGTGKTSTARILAKMVNCSEQPLAVSNSLLSNSEKQTAKSSTPCNKCDSCKSITDGSNLDLIEIDAASNRGIDDIRSLRENIKLSPTGGKKKVYIIDEVHMLTTEAFNALLKTLEEPPAHVLFILATTDVQKVPQTILSRVQRLDFKLASVTEITQALQKIVAEEKIEIEDEALKFLAKRADGSFRDGVKLLDQLSSTGEKITLAQVVEKTQSVEFTTIFKFLNLLSEKNTKDCLLLISENLKNVDVKNWLLGLLDMMRSLMLIKNGLGDELVSPDLDGEKYKFLVKLSDRFSMQDLVVDLEHLQNAQEKLKFASIATLPLEIAVVKMTQGVPVIANHEEVKQIASSRTPRNDNNNSVILNPAESGINSVKDLPSTDSVPTSEDSSSMIPQNDTGKSDDVASAEVAVLQEKWTFILETVKPFNFSLEALLRLVKILDCKEGNVVLEVPYSFHQRILEAPKSRDLLESVLSDVLSKSVKVTCVLGSNPMRAEDVANVEVAADDEVVRAAAEIFGSETVN